jgi:hypothetical protein
MLAEQDWIDPEVYPAVLCSLSSGENSMVMATTIGVWAQVRVYSGHLHGVVPTVRIVQHGPIMMLRRSQRRTAWAAFLFLLGECTQQGLYF